MQIVGGTCVGLGTWSFMEESSQLSMIRVQNIKDIMFNISLALMLIGVIVFSMSFAGCLGALRENLCLLKLVSTLILVRHSVSTDHASSSMNDDTVFIDAVDTVYRRNRIINGGLRFPQFTFELPEGVSSKRPPHEVSGRC